MKKLVLLLAVAFSVSMFSCGSGDKNECCDSTACDSCTATEEVAAATEEVTPDSATVEVAEVTDSVAPVAE